MSADQEHNLGLITQVATQERAEAFSQAADLLGGIAVNVLDPSIPKDADTFAVAAAQKEVAFYSSGIQYNGPRRQPRTSEQIKKEVVKHALEGGSVLVIIRHSQNDLGDFWKRVDQISA